MVQFTANLILSIMPERNPNLIKVIRLLKTTSSISIAPEITAATEGTKKEVFNRIKKSPEVVTDPNSPDLAGFHDLMTRIFNTGEVEPLEVFQKELAESKLEDAQIKYICIVMKDPLLDEPDKDANGEKKINTVVSGAYGSVQKGVLAFRFTATECDQVIIDEQEGDEIGTAFKNGEFVGYRNANIAEKADKALIHEAEKESLKKGEPLRALVGECVAPSEAFWNRCKIAGNGMKRLYSPDTNEQIYYRLPPLEWNSDGTPTSNAIITENLQVAFAGHPNQVPVETLIEALRSWWKSWYFRPRDMFESDEAHAKHTETVKAILEDEVIAPLKKHKVLNLLSKAEREKIT